MSWKHAAKAAKSGTEVATPEHVRLGVGVVEARGVRGREEAVAFVMNGAGPDRGGDIVHHAGARLESFLANPVMPWGHDYRGLPLGTWEGVTVDRAGNLRGVGVFSAREVYPFAETVLQMYLRRILRACSIGFRPIKWTWNEQRGPHAVDYLEYELLECSAVMIGQHQDALATVKAAEAAGLNVGPVLEELERVLEGEGRGLWLPAAQARAVVREMGPRFFDLAPATRARAEALELAGGGNRREVAGASSSTPGLGRSSGVGASPGAVAVPVLRCAACGGAHGTVDFVALSAPKGTTTHWGRCPDRGDPVFLEAVTRVPGAAGAGDSEPEPDQTEWERDLARAVREAVRDAELATSGAFLYEN